METMASFAITPLFLSQSWKKGETDLSQRLRRKIGSSSAVFHKNRQKSPSVVQIHAKAVIKRSPKRLKYSGSGSKKMAETLVLQLDPSGTDTTRLYTIIGLIKDGAVGIIPTDTVYAIVCDLKNRTAVDRLYRIKDMDRKKPLSILCRNFQDIDLYTMGFPRGDSHGQTNVFRQARQCLPGPVSPEELDRIHTCAQAQYTFILNASKDMPKQCTLFGGSEAARCAPRKSVGVRMPDDPICQALLAQVEDPLLCTSITRDANNEWLCDPATIQEAFGTRDGREGVDFIIDGGVRVADPSTVIDMTGATPLLLRLGKGVVEDWMMMDASGSELEINPYRIARA